MVAWGMDTKSKKRRQTKMKREITPGKVLKLMPGVDPIQLECGCVMGYRLCDAAQDLWAIIKAMIDDPPDDLAEYVQALENYRSHYISARWLGKDGDPGQDG